MRKICLIIGICGLCAFTASCTKTGRQIDAFPNKGELVYPYDSIPVDSDMVHTCISENGKMRFTCWNTGEGGTCPDFAVICQFIDSKYEIMTIKLHEKEDMVAWVNEIHSLLKKNGSTYYIVERSHNASSQEGYSWMDAFVIDADTLISVSVYDGGPDLDNCGMEVAYNIPDWYFTTNGEGWDWIFEYDKSTHNLYVPITIDDKITDRYRVYNYNGNEFVSKEICPHKDIHRSLADYKQLEYFFRTKDHIIRIDKLENNELRYASWESSSTMSDKPQLVIVGGTEDPNTGIICFKNNGFKYSCKVNEDVNSGNEIETKEYLVIERNNKVLKKEEKINLY